MCSGQGFIFCYSGLWGRAEARRLTWKVVLRILSHLTGPNLHILRKMFSLDFIIFIINLFAQLVFSHWLYFYLKLTVT